MMKLIQQLKKIFGRKPPASNSNEALAKAVIIPQKEHKIPYNRISINAQKVLHRLNDKGYHAYIVGGGVRDLLLDKTPKDFDIATDAHPEQVRKIFSNCRLIGKRFRLAHIYFGRHIIEVATFRASHENAPEQHAKTEGGRLVRDNVYGTIEDDVHRRDFSINSLYYDGHTHEILDFTNAMQDIQQKQIRILGEPTLRYREDPVRILRAIRFSAKLDFEIEERTATPMYKFVPLLKEVSNSRLFEEMQKIFLSGHSQKVLELLQKYHCFELLFPTAHKLFTEKHIHALKLVQLTLENTDNRIAEGKPVTIAFIFASLLWYQVEELTSELRSQNYPPIPAIEKAIGTIVHEQSKIISIPKRISLMMRDMWVLQYRLHRRLGNRAFKLLEHRRFRAAYDFLLLRTEAGEQISTLGDWWTKFQHADNETQQSMVSSISKKRHHLQSSKNQKKASTPADQS